jgi:hypothetical protein
MHTCLLAGQAIHERLEPRIYLALIRPLVGRCRLHGPSSPTRHHPVLLQTIRHGRAADHRRPPVRGHRRSAPSRRRRQVRRAVLLVARPIQRRPRRRRTAQRHSLRYVLHRWDHIRRRRRLVTAVGGDWEDWQRRDGRVGLHDNPRDLQAVERVRVPPLDGLKIGRKYCNGANPWTKYL